MLREQPVGTTDVRGMHGGTKIELSAAVADRGMAMATKSGIWP
jgi:hypothetical protein